MKLACIFVLSLAAGACNPFGTKQPEPDPQVLPTGPGPRETGNCNNEHVEGSCTFTGLGALGGQNASGPAGTTVFRIRHQIEIKDDCRKEELTSMFLSVPTELRDDLAEYYRQRSPTPCKAYIVRPPCAPQATWVNLGFDPPEFAKVERF
jgi:hypothetical protein